MSKQLDDTIATSLNQALHMKVCCFKLKTTVKNSISKSGSTLFNYRLCRSGGSITTLDSIKVPTVPLTCLMRSDKTTTGRVHESTPPAFVVI